MNQKQKNKQERPRYEKLNASPWEIQPRETSRAFRAFCLYRDMGKDRTLQQVANELNKALITINLLSQRWNWVERVRAWTNEMDKKRTDAMLKEIQEMAKRHIKESQIFQRVLLLPADALLKRLEKDNDGKVKDFDNTSTQKLFDNAVKSAQVFSNIIGIERTSRGEPTDITKQDVTSNGETIKVILPTLPPAHPLEDED